MSALSAASVQQENLGSLTLHIVRFSSISSGDTYASGLGTNVVSWMTAGTANVGTGTNLASFNATNSSGTFTFSGSITSLAGTLWIVSKS